MLGYRPRPVRRGIREALRWYQEQGLLSRERPLTPRGVVELGSEGDLPAGDVQRGGGSVGPAHVDADHAPLLPAESLETASVNPRSATAMPSMRVTTSPGWRPASAAPPPGPPALPAPAPPRSGSPPPRFPPGPWTASARPTGRSSDLTSAGARAPLIASAVVALGLDRHVAGVSGRPSREKRPSGPVNTELRTSTESSAGAPSTASWAPASGARVCASRTTPGACGRPEPEVLLRPCALGGRQLHPRPLRRAADGAEAWSW